ncbi:MAG: hypothetical protein RIR91_1176 [Verrucomicrobiota bacterium]|jgi:hypothetical protein
MVTLDVIFADAAGEVVKVVKDPNAVSNNFQGAILAFKKGGWIVSLIGAAAMVGRLLIDDAADANWRRSAKHILAAALFAIIAFFVTYQWEMSAINKAIIQGLTGALAPELVDWISANIKAKLGIKDKKPKGRGRKRSSGRKRSKPKTPVGDAPKPSRRKPR